MTRRKTIEEFINEARSVHQDKYDYSGVVYISGGKAVTIRCKKCNYIFEQRPNNHIHSKRGCHLCAIESTTSYTRKSLEHYLPRLEEIHGNKYDFSSFIYVNSKTKSIINCSCGNSFNMSMEKLLRGQGCSHCKSGGFKPDRPCYLYVMRIGTTAIKCGISVDPEYRQTKISNKTEKEVLILYKFYFKTSTKAKELEDEIKKIFTGSFLNKEEFGDGFTETFNDNTIGSILKVCLKFCDNNQGVMSTGNLFNKAP